MQSYRDDGIEQAIRKATIAKFTEDMVQKFDGLMASVYKQDGMLIYQINYNGFTICGRGNTLLEAYNDFLKHNTELKRTAEAYLERFS